MQTKTLIAYVLLLVVIAEPVTAGKPEPDFKWAEAQTQSSPPLGSHVMLTLQNYHIKANRGSIVIFGGAIKNLGPETFYLSSWEIDFPIVDKEHPTPQVETGFKLDNSQYGTPADSTPRFLLAGQFYAGQFFSEIVDPRLKPGTYHGRLGIYGGAKSNSYDVHYTQEFTLTVSDGPPETVAGDSLPHFSYNQSRPLVFHPYPDHRLHQPP